MHEPRFRVLNSANFKGGDTPVWNSQTSDFEPRPFPTLETEAAPATLQTLDFAPHTVAFPTRGRNYLVTCNFAARGHFADAFLHTRLSTNIPLFVTAELSRQSASVAAFVVFVPLAGGSYSDPQSATLTLHARGDWTETSPTAALTWTVEGPL